MKYGGDWYTRYLFLCHRRCGKYVMTQREMQRRYLEAVRLGRTEIFLAD